MRWIRLTALSLSLGLLAFAPVWAQDQNAAQTAPAPPPAGAPAAPRRAMIHRAGPGRGGRVVIRRGPGMMGPRRAMVFRGGFRGGRLGPMGRGMGGFRGGPGVMRFGAMAGLRGPMFGMGAGLARMVNNPNFRKRLGITGAQASKIRQQSLDFQVAQIHSRANLQVDRLQLRNLLTAQSPNSTAIDRKLDQISAAQLAARKQEVAYLLAMRNVLTPEQQQKLRQLREAPVQRGGRAQAPPATAPPAAQPHP
jgi:Spy/CpxP family protein refolding chaperone